MRPHRRAWNLAVTAVLACALALTGVLDLGPGVAFAQGGAKHHFSIVGDDGSAITNGRCRFLTAGTNTNLTIYTDRSNATTTSNPVTIDTTSGSCEAYLPSATDTVDLIVYVDGGSYKGSMRRADAVSRTTGKKIVVNGGSPMKVLAVPLPTAASSSNQTTTYTVPAGAVIKDVVLETTTAVAASTIQVGSAQDGFHGRLCNASSTAATGFVNCAPSSLLHTASAAITVHNTNHDVDGFAHVFYLLAAND